MTLGSHIVDFLHRHRQRHEGAAVPSRCETVTPLVAVTLQLLHLARTHASSKNFYYQLLRFAVP